jgi:DNA polymerase-3 subunit epsilon
VDRPMKLPVLPVYYYLHHFSEMLSFVGMTYGSILTAEHQAFIARFNDFDKDAQCLLIRMINRRGTIFNRDHFRYSEIVDANRALQDLHVAGYARTLCEADYSRFLSCLPKTELLTGAKNAGVVEARSSWSKPKLIEFFLAKVPFCTAFEYCGGKRYVALDQTEPVDFLLYLYFGKTEDDLRNFALRDLGILRTNKAASFSARFTDNDEAKACFHYSRLLDRLATKSIHAYRDAIEGILSGPVCPTEYAAELRGRAACEVGQFFEKQEEIDLARQLYRIGTSADCRERLVRLTYRLGDKADAEDLLRRMIDDPVTDQEHTFALDFYARKFGGQRTGLCTDLLRSGSTITVDDTHRGNPEAGVAGVMRRRGFRVFFTENTLWHSLFGLLFWDELFESGQLHSGFDWMPQCLMNKTFSRQFAEQIEQKVAALRSGEALNLLLKVITAKWGRPNGIFSWDHVDIDALRLLLDGTSKDGLAAIVKAMTEDFRAMRDGFPDLMLAKNDTVSFIEVKAEGDVIRRNQLTRLRQLGNAGIKADIGRVDYRFDPEQDYVVVDIETTGGWRGSDRITEIGAVKIRNHQVIGEWHSLLNPQKAIPTKIVQLTGITNDMVRGAPLFAEIADSFMAFMGDGIFVAHNVNFDYGFIAAEYERLARKFQFPKVCTCAGMRRRFPGQKSYGLGNLCATFGIDLENHHRALCDARAAARLLNLMNAKREASELDAVAVSSAA